MVGTYSPFRQAFFCAGIHYALAILAAIGSHNLSGLFAQSFLGPCCYGALSAAFWAGIDQHYWSWRRFTITYIALFFLFRLAYLSPA